MHGKQLLAIMGKMLKLHKSLYDLSEKKTDVIKKGDMNALNQILKDEQAHVAAISKLESERQTIAAFLLPDLDKPTLFDCLNVLEGVEKTELEQKRDELMEVIKRLQEKNDFNQQLIFQSMQFVNFSLSLVAPMLQTQTMNYGPDAGRKRAPGSSYGMFNTKA